VTARLRILLLLLLSPALLRAQDELGLGRMWTFHDPPLEYLKRTYDFVPDAQWLDAVRLASLRFGSGCSASFVSPHGLILTNHHCARSAIARAQGPADWVRDGFCAGSHLEEVRLPDLAVEQLVAMRDVTDEVLEGVDDGGPPDVQAQRKADNEKKVLEAARARSPKLRAQVVALFHGAQFQLYQYRVFDDVRLVMAPHLQVAHFGGDPDNFVYPRYGIDFALCRAWVDGAPADTADCSFGWSDGPKDGQLVFLSGNPGSTQRLLTTAQLEFLRDERYPRVREQIDHRLAILRRTAADPEQEKQLRTTILGYENGQKLYRGEHGALLDAGFLQRKAAAESKFKARLLAVPELAARFGDVFDRLAEVATARRALEGRAVFHGSGGFPPLHRALALAALQSTGDRAAIDEARRLRAAEPAVQIAFFTDHLERARNWLQKDDPFLATLLSGRDARAVAERLAASRLADPEAFEELVRGGVPAIAACDDHALLLARRLLPLQTAARAEAQALDARERALLARLGQALFAVYGHEVTPDATFTLRFSDGIVRGYDYNGTRAPWRTVFHGMFARHAEFDAQYPFDLPVPWLLAKDRIDLCAAVDFVCTVDSTGGNSGSPVIDAQRRIVGLLFDGNIESLGNEFCFGDRVERSVCVHPQAILESLTKVYAGAHLARELRREPR
jgi:hypothetical protein